MRYALAFRFADMSNEWSMATKICNTEEEAKEYLEKHKLADSDAFWAVVPLPDLDSLPQHREALTKSEYYVEVIDLKKGPIEENRWVRQEDSHDSLARAEDSAWYIRRLWSSCRTRVVRVDSREETVYCG